MYIILIHIDILNGLQVYNLRNEKLTILNHFDYVRSKVKLSNVMPYGDFTVGLDKLSEFIGKSQEIFSKHNNNDHNMQLSMKHNVSIDTM